MAMTPLNYSASFDPRADFWRDPSKWPRNTSQHSFIADVVHDLGRRLFGEKWTGNEPETVLIFPIRQTLDSATPDHDKQVAIQILCASHQGFRAKADQAMLLGLVPPLPSPDEWSVAYAYSRQLADSSHAAYQRYVAVINTLVCLFELGIVVACRRHHVCGLPAPIPAPAWINEVYLSWFATCQINPDDPFSGIPICDGGDWLYVDIDSYVTWRDASLGALPQKAAMPSASSSHAAEPPDFARPDEPAFDAPTGDSESIVEQPSSAASRQEPSRPEQRSERERQPEAPEAVQSRQRARSSGAKPRYNWQQFEEEVLKRAQSKDRPDSERQFAQGMLEWCQETWGREPGESTARTHVTKVLKANGLQYSRATASQDC